MEQGYFDEIDTQENKDVLLNNPPKVDKQLENLYRALKHLQVYCIKINTTPNLNWQDFMKLYRKGLDAKLDDKVEYILLTL